MKGHRNRQPVKPDYTHALGQAAFSFSILEWNVVWSCERIKPGALRKIVGDEFTAGRIAKRFIDLVHSMPKSAAREDLGTVAQEFAKLVQVRNKILHGKPCTGPNGDARLSSGRILETVDLEDAADAFSECSCKVNELLHGFLETYVPN
jgi:hypothetical protein